MADNPIPTPRDDDDEDVHWALSTSLTLWSRGERAEALKWLKRAAEQASDADKDIRSLELFKAAAELQPLAAASVAPPPQAAPPPPPAPAPQAAAPVVVSAQNRMPLPPPPLPTNRPPPPPARPPQPSHPPMTQASPATTPAPTSIRSAPPPAPRASARPPAMPPGQTPAPPSVAPPPRVPSMPSAPPPAAAALRTPVAATPAPPPVALPTRKRLPSRTGARKSVAADPLARTGKHPVAPAGVPQGGPAKPSGGSGKRAAPKTTIIDQQWGDYAPTPALQAPPPPPPPEAEEVTAARNRAALLDMPIDDLDGVTNIFSGRDVAKQVAAARAGVGPGSQPHVAQAPVTIMGLPAPTMHAIHPHAPPSQAPASHAPASHTPAPSSAQPHAVQSVRPKTGPASVRPGALPPIITHQTPAAAQPAQAHAHPPQAAPLQPAAATHAPAAAPLATTRVATLTAVRVAVFGREGDIRVLALAPQAAAPPGTVTALLVPTSDTEAAALAKLFGY